MNVSELKAAVESAGHDAHFFSRKTMQFFGDTMKNYGVRAIPIRTRYDDNDRFIEEGVPRDAWELYRKRPVKHGLADSAYFDSRTFRQVFPIK